MKPVGGPTAIYRTRFGVLCILAYVALSWAVRFDMRLGGQIASLIYPLDTFSMYAGMPDKDRSHLLLRDRHETVHRITAFRSIDCPGLTTGEALPCADRRGIPYMVEDFIDYIRTHPGGGEREVELIARTWDLHAGAAPTQAEDCVIARCTVSP
jgi:hypothetical protein